MPDPNSPLELTLRQIKDHLIDMELMNPFAQNEINAVMAPIRAMLINFRNLELGTSKPSPELHFCADCMCSYITNCQCPEESDR